MAKRKNSYWQKRIQEQRDKQYKRLVRETESALASLYREQAEELKRDVIEVLAKIQSEKGTEGGIQANDLYRSKRYWELLDELNARLKSLGAKQMNITAPTLIEAYEETQSLIEKEIPKTKPVGATFLVASQIQPEQVVNQVWCLDGKKFSDRVWNDKTRLLQQLKKALSDSLVRGKSNWEIAKAMADKLEVSRENAYRLVRTETAHAQVYAQTQKYKEYGFVNGIYLASDTCCEECKKHDGERYTLDELEKMLPVHPHCTCSYTLAE